MTDADALVFVVDDDASLRASLQDLLASVGLQVVACASAQDFLRRPRPEGPSCLVLVDAAPFEAATWASTFGTESSLPGRVWASRAPVCIPDVVQDPGLLRATLGSQIGQFIERQRADEALRQAQAELAHATRIWCKIQRAKE
jgi:hypothetical protein